MPTDWTVGARAHRLGATPLLGVRLARSRSATAFSNGAYLGFEAKLWQAAEHKHVLIVMLAPYRERVYDSYHGSRPLLTSGEAP